MEMRPHEARVSCRLVGGNGDYRSESVSLSHQDRQVENRWGHRSRLAILMQTVYA